MAGSEHSTTAAAPRGGAAPGETEITLGLLSAVEENEAITQRSVARELGIALGLANAYLKRCVRKGLIKVQQVPPNRYAYYLTPQGFTEKSRLTAEYLSSSFTFFRRARGQCEEALSRCAARGWRRVALAGGGDLAEIMLLCAGEHGIALSGVIDCSGVGDRAFQGLPVPGRAGEPGAVDAVIVTDLQDPQGVYEALLAVMPEERILTLPVLRVSRERHEESVS